MNGIDQGHARIKVGDLRKALEEAYKDGAAHGLFVGLFAGLMLTAIIWWIASL